MWQSGAPELTIFLLRFLCFLGLSCLCSTDTERGSTPLHLACWLADPALAEGPPSVDKTTAGTHLHGLAEVSKRSTRPQAAADEVGFGEHLDSPFPGEPVQAEWGATDVGGHLYSLTPTHSRRKQRLLRANRKQMPDLTRSETQQLVIVRPMTVKDRELFSTSGRATTTACVDRALQ